MVEDVAEKWTLRLEPDDGSLPALATAFCVGTGIVSPFVRVNDKMVLPLSRTVAVGSKEMFVREPEAPDEDAPVSPDDAGAVEEPDKSLPADSELLPAFGDVVWLPLSPWLDDEPPEEF